jgi:uncharacterized protein (DUF3820 family)
MQSGKVLAPVGRSWSGQHENQLSEAAMTKMNYARVGAARRVQVWSQKYTASKSAADQNDYEWMPMPFGRYENMSLPQLIMTAPQYFYWLYRDRKLHGKLGHQADIVAGRAAHILPPLGSLEHEFLFELDEAGGLKRIKLLQTCKHAKTKRAVRSKHLDMAIILSLGDNRWAASKLLADWFRSTYYPGSSADYNFDICCAEDHAVSKTSNQKLR